MPDAEASRRPCGGPGTLDGLSVAPGGSHQVAIDHVCLVRDDESRGTRTHNLRMKSELSCHRRALTATLRRPVRMKPHFRAARCRRVPVRFGTAEPTASRQGPSEILRLPRRANCTDRAFGRRTFTGKVRGTALRNPRTRGCRSGLGGLPAGVPNGTPNNGRHLSQKADGPSSRRLDRPLAYPAAGAPSGEGRRPDGRCRPENRRKHDGGCQV